MHEGGCRNVIRDAIDCKLQIDHCKFSICILQCSICKLWFIGLPIIKARLNRVSLPTTYAAFSASTV